jgi:hypothetical protein
VIPDGANPSFSGLFLFESTFEQNLKLVKFFTTRFSFADIQTIECVF